MKQILFSGAGGYIGSHTAYCFLSNTNYNITIIDNLSSGFIENIDFLKATFGNRISFIDLDLSDTNTLETLLKKHSFYAVIHFAASLIVPESTIKPLLYYSNNTKNTLQLIELCVKYNVNNFIFSSTAAVYGEAQIVPVKEDSPLLPINPYGSSKMMSEMILRDTAAAHNDFHFITLRYFNVAGALHNNDYTNLAHNNGLGQRSKKATHLIKVACECATGKRESISIFGSDYDTKDGTCIRDYIHIDDIAMAHLNSLEYLENTHTNNIFNVGYNRGFSVKEIVDKVKEISGVDFIVHNAPRRVGDPAKLIANNAKILSHTSWKPMYDDIDIIIKSAYEWEKYML